MPESPNLSTRTYTFLFTDLEGSTHLWERYPRAMKPALARHDEILRQAVERSNGQIIKTTGDGLHAYFNSVMDGITACLNTQRNLTLEPWGETGPLKVRMGLHVGEAQPRGGDFYGPAVNRAARLMSAAHGGQVLISKTAADLVRDLLEGEISLQDLGEHRLKDLDRSEHIFQLNHPDLTSDFPPIISLDYRPNNLPAQLTPLIGRASELAEIIEQIKSERVRVLTLTGLGGIGKTRLSLQVCADLIDFFKDGVYFIDLAPIRDPESVPAAIAQIVATAESSRRPPMEEIKSQLQTKSMLLLLDNFEQVTSAAPMISELMNACPNIKALVTSREALHIRGEFVYPVPPLDLPKVDLQDLGTNHFERYEAVQLFVERAKAAKHDFDLSAENARIVAEICIRLDGLPLAIELAAARIRLFPPEALLKRLENRLKILSSGASDLPDRQQTLRNAIDWSYELLDSGEQSLFMLLSVFTGGFSFEAVEEIQEGIDLPDFTRVDILDGLTSLEEKSLISRMDHEDGETRLKMLETIRDYADDKLAEKPGRKTAVQTAHAEFFANFTKDRWESLIGSGREASLAALSKEIENIQTAWRYWVAKKDLEYLSKFVDSLWMLYDVRGWYHATVNLTNELLEVLSAVPSTPERVQQEIVLQTSLARALLAIKGYTPEVEGAYKRAIELWQDESELPEIFPVLRGLTAFYTYRGEFAKSTDVAKKILSLAETHRDEDMLVEGHLVLGYSLAFLDDLHLGLEHLEKGISLYDPDKSSSHRYRLGSNPGVVGRNASALIQWMLGFPDRALIRSREAVALAKRLNHPFSIAYAQFHSGLLSFWRREPEQIEECSRAVLEIAREHEFQVWQAVATCLQGAALAGMGQTGKGLILVREGMDMYQGLNTPPIFWPMLIYMHAGVCWQVGEPARGLTILEEGLQIGALSSGRTLLPEFLRLHGELIYASRPEDADQAENQFLLALEVAQELGARMMELRTAASLFRLWENQGSIDRGKQLLETVYAKFDEGFDTADLLEAGELLKKES